VFDIDVTSTSSLVGMTAAADPAGWEQPDLAVVAQRATRRAGGAGESDGRQQDAAPARQVGDGEVPTAQTQVMLRASSPSVACWILRPVAGEILRPRGDGRAEDEPSHIPEPTYLVLLAQDRPDHSLAIAELPLDYLARLLHAVDATPPAAHPGPAVAATPGRAGGHPRHRQEARRPRPGQARRGQPHRSRSPSPTTRPDQLARRPHRPPTCTFVHDPGGKRFHQQVHLRVTSTPPPPTYRPQHLQTQREGSS
jgi:hypothetical protein